MDARNNDPIPQGFSNEERERLEQELLELHFGCHPDPDALAARLLREPLLRELQQKVLHTADVLLVASTPSVPPLALRPAKRGPQVAWWRRPVARSTAVAAAAAVTVAAFAVHHGYCSWQDHHARAQELHLTISAPQAVPPGAPWSFTLDCLDLDNRPRAETVRWRAVGQDGNELHGGTTLVDGRAVVAIPAGLAVPKQLEVVAERSGRPLRQTLDFITSMSPPLVHISTDKPVYQPGEPVLARAVVLDRATLQPVAAGMTMQARILDPKGAPVFQQPIAIAVPVQGPQPAGVPPGLPSTGALVWPVPESSAGGEYTIEVMSMQQAWPPERLPFVVRRFEPPRLQKDLVLDRKTYAPGATGSAQLDVTRLGGGASAGAAVRAALVLDGKEVWTQDGILSQQGSARFRFQVPREVERGAARFVASITDGGIVETEVEPFVVPTGEVKVAAFPEGGELVAGVPNRVYFEVTDALGRPVDTAAALVDDQEQRVATFATAHQGRARVAFTPEAGRSYRVHAAGLKEPLPLPAVAERGIALQGLGDGVPAGTPVRVHVAGRGDGPWLCAAFCRGLMLGQAVLTPAADGSIDRDVTVEVPATAAGVLRVTVFDRTLRPVAERLLRRAASQRVEVELVAQHGKLAPGQGQQLTVRTKTETGEPVPAIVGVAVTDGASIAMGDEPRIGLLDQALLFADVERLEDLGDWFVGAEHGERNVDLLLGTRGWRRFVWRNDAAAQAAIAAAGDWAGHQLLREGFAQTPQVTSNKDTVGALAAVTGRAADASRRLLADVALGSIVLLLLWIVTEALLRVRIGRLPPVLVPVSAFGAAALAVMLWQPQALGVGDRALPAGDMQFAADFAEVRLFAAFAPAPAAQPDLLAALGAERFDVEAGRAAAADDFFLGIDKAARGDQDRLANLRVHRLAELADELGFRKVEFQAIGGGGGRGWLEGIAGPGGPGAAGPVGGRGLFGEGEGKRGRLHAGFEFYSRFQQPLRVYAHRHAASEQRSDFTQTICWQPLLVTDGNGEAVLKFDTSDAVTTWHVRADAHAAGRVGQAESTFTAQLPLHVECKLPTEVLAGDRLSLPVAVTLENGGAATAKVQVQVEGPLSLQSPANAELVLVEGRGRLLVDATVADAIGTAKVKVVVAAGGFRDEVARSFPVLARGFPHGRSWGGAVSAALPGRLVVSLPAQAVAGSGHCLLRVFPSPLAAMQQGLQGILQEPNGCFEQASSSNYPNVMVLSYLEASGDDVPAVAARARELLPRGYQKITGYECKQRGYEWFGGDPGHESLSAYGLLQFHDMQKVYEVDAGMVLRTKDWLLARRDGKGGYQRNSRALDSFGRAPAEVTDAYVTYALLHTGVKAADMKTEVDAIAARALVATDAYELAVIACALHDAGHAAAATARTRLQGLQKEDGSLRGSTTSITSSGGNDLAVETTAFAVLAWLPDQALTGAVRKSLEFLQAQGQANGRFGASQATVCALRALAAYATANRMMPAGGTLTVFAGQKKLVEKQFEAGQQQPVDFELWPLLPPGEHELRVELQGGGDAPLPWACDVGYHAELPADDPQAKVGIAMRLLAATVEEGRTVGLEVLLRNLTADGQPMAMAIVGLPAGLDLPTSVLDDLKKAQAFDLWEIRGRELVLYWRSLAPNAEHRVQLDLVAAIPGVSTGPAGRSYLYYTPAEKKWASPLRVTVTAAK